ncbi:MAG: LPS export ABC transporter periplasmic protein LptC [Alistipes sp.]|nr:LPS export ABC transporter periplasmic protein LptC [Alistipes sp.]
MTTDKRNIISYIRTALLAAGSAFCIFACGRGAAEEEDTSEGLLTQEAFNLTIIESTNGVRSTRFETPLMETYEYAREPYREFRKGVTVISYNSDTGEVESTLVADYAIQFLNQELWEAKGNVVATNAQGHKLETQQLFWNQKTGRIYSNIDSKITQDGGEAIGVGFESDEQFTDWEFRRPRGTIDVDVESTKTPGEGYQGDGPDGTFTYPEDTDGAGDPGATPEEAALSESSQPTNPQPEPEPAAPAPPVVTGPSEDRPRRTPSRLKSTEREEFRLAEEDPDKPDTESPAE